MAAGETRRFLHCATLRYGRDDNSAEAGIDATERG